MYELPRDFDWRSHLRLVRRFGLGSFSSTPTQLVALPPQLGNQQTPVGRDPEFLAQLQASAVLELPMSVVRCAICHGGFKPHKFRDTYWLACYKCYTVHEAPKQHHGLIEDFLQCP